MADRTIGQLLVALNADTKQFEASMQESLTRTQGFVAGHEAQFKKIGAAVTAAGAAITASLGLAIKTYANAGDAAAKMAKRTGMSVENIMQLKHAADLSGTSIEGLETGVKRMARVISDAEYGLETAQRPLNELGITLDQIKGKKPDEQFNLLATALANVEDPTKKAALAQEIFGRAGTQLLPMLSEGAAGLEKMKQEAVDLGLVMSADAAKKAEEFNDSITSLKGSLQGVRNAIAEQIMPTLTPLIQKITEVIKNITEWTKRNPGLTKAIVTIAGVIGVLATVLGPIIMALPMIVSGITTLTTIIPALGAVFGALTGPIGWVMLAIAGLIVIGKLLIKHWDDIKIGMAKVWNAIVGFVESGVNAYIKYINFLIRAILGTINKLISGINKIPGINIPQITVPQIKEASFGRIDTASMISARAEKTAEVTPTGVQQAAEATTGGGVTKIEVNNPLSPDDLAKVIRAVERSQEMKGYIKTGLQGA